MVINPIYKRCDCKSEDVFHALIDYKATRKVWKFTKFHEEVKQLAHQDLLSVLLELAMRRKKKELELIVAVCWAI